MDAGEVPSQSNPGDIHFMLSSLMASMSKVNSRLEKLESVTTALTLAGPPAASPAQVDMLLVAPPITQEDQEVSPAHMIPEHLKRDILEGKDVNLTSLLIASQEIVENKTYAYDDVSVVTMNKENLSSDTEIRLLGFHQLHTLRSSFFSILLIVYILTISVNFVLIVLVSSTRHLHVPMYIFLTQVSICDIVLTTTIAPIMLNIVLYEGGVMSLADCITQFCLFGAFEASECFLLTAMSYDRYVAICHPLHYNFIMDNECCITLIIMSWLLGLSIALVITLTLAQLRFCGPNIIDHVICDFAPLLQIFCSDTFIVQMTTILLCVPVFIIPLTIIMVSYFYIVLTIVKIPSISGRQKAFSTCSSHLAVVSIYYGTLISMYAVPTKDQSLSLSKVLSLLYTVVTPVLNPIIYSLRNKDIKEALTKCQHKLIQTIYRTSFSI
ncbi:olfactory receptor 5P52-like [Pelodytes ibericus]